MAVFHSKGLYFTEFDRRTFSTLLGTNKLHGRPNVPEGEATVQGRGSEALTNEGDPLVNSGTDARKVPIEFAKGYTKGVSD